MSITQEMRYRLSAIKCAERYGVKLAAIKCHTSPASIYRWRKLYYASNKDIRSLQNGSRRPHAHPNAHTQAEITLIRNLRRRNPRLGLQDFWLRLRQHGYTRSQPALLKLLRRLELYEQPKTLPSPTCRKSQTYTPMTYPGERIQIDVKYVPRDCIDPAYLKQAAISGLYQYTAIDEFSRYRILWGVEEHNTYTSSLSLIRIVKHFEAMGIEVKCVQTDNGPEFTKQFIAKNANNHSMFEVTARQLQIKLKHIKPHTPKHNGKVERSHREDQKLFYSEIIRTGRLITDVNNLRKRLKKHQNRTNRRPMRPLNYLSPLQYIEQYKQKKIK